MEAEERLEAYERMQRAVITEYEKILEKMEGLRKQGKTKSVTYRELLGKKMVYQNMLSFYEVYGLGNIDG